MYVDFCGHVFFFIVVFVIIVLAVGRSRKLSRGLKIIVKWKYFNPQVSLNNDLYRSCFIGRAIFEFLMQIFAANL